MKVVIFGLKQLSSLAWYVLTHDSTHQVVGFTADRAWCSQTRLHDLPVLPIDILEKTFPPSTHAMLIPLGWTRCNGLRAERYADAQSRGYRFVSYLSSRALVWPDLQVGENCLIFEGAIVEPFARIGDNCILRSGCHVSHHAVVGSHSFLAANSVVAGSSVLGERCFLGLNSTVRDGVVVAPRCFVAAGALVTADTEPDSLYVGVPARRRPLPQDL